MTTLSTVGDHMAQRLITLSPSQEINSAARVLLDNNVSGAPVIGEAGHLVGLLTEKDCLLAALDANYYRDWGRSVEVYMAKNLTTMHPETNILTACQTLLDGPFRRFPVVSSGRLVGMISRSDILRALADTWG